MGNRSHGERKQCAQHRKIVSKWASPKHAVKRNSPRRKQENVLVTPSVILVFKNHEKKLTVRRFEDGQLSIFQMMDDLLK